MATTHLVFCWRQDDVDPATEDSRQQRDLYILFCSVSERHRIQMTGDENGVGVRVRFLAYWLVVNMIFQFTILVHTNFSLGQGFYALDKEVRMWRESRRNTVLFLLSNQKLSKSSPLHTWCSKNSCLAAQRPCHMVTKSAPTWDEETM